MKARRIDRVVTTVSRGSASTAGSPNGPSVRRHKHGGHMSRRNFAITVLLFMVSFLIVERAQSALHNWLIFATGLENGPSNAWPPLLLAWAVGVVVFVAIGILLAGLLRAQRIVWWAVAFGVAYGVLRFG